MADDSVTNNGETCANACNFSNNVNYTCDQLADYCQRYTEYTAVDRWSTSYSNISMAVCGIIGVIGYFCMAGTLVKMKLRRTSTIYYQAMIAMEAIHMMIMIESGIVRQIQTPNTYWWVLWIRQLSCGWYFGDAMKLAVTILASFVSLESACAIVTPTYYRRCNKTWMAAVVTVLSVAVGCIIYMPGVVSHEVLMRDDGTWNSGWSVFGNGEIMQNLVTSQYVCKLGFSVFLLAVSCVIVIGLRIKSRNADRLSTEDRKDWKATYRLSMLSLIIGLTSVIDNVCWIIYRDVSYKNNAVVGTDGVRRLSYEQAVANMSFQYTVNRARLAQIVMGEIVHCGRFYLYLLFNKSFRKGFAKFTKKDSTLISSSGAY